MKTLSMGTMSFAVLGIVIVALIALGPPSSRTPATPTVISSPASSPSTVTTGGFTLVSQSIQLPLTDQQYPAAPHADVINANCTACHSASMALNQPPLSADQWQATVTKMRETYKAPVAQKDVPAILSYLNALSAGLGSSSAGQPQGSASKPEPDHAGDPGGATG